MEQMETVILDGRVMIDEESFHDELFRKLDFPDFYGRNLNATWDLLTGHIGPARIVWKHFSVSKQAMDEAFINSACDVFRAAEEEYSCIVFRTE